MDTDKAVWEPFMRAIKKSGFISPFFLSIVIHFIGLYLLVLFPPSKAIIFFKAHKKSHETLSSSKEKLIEEISVITIPKKKSLPHSEILNEEIDTISQNNDYIPHIDFSKLLDEKLDFSFPIDTTTSFSLSPLEKVDRSYETYLSPITTPIPQDLLENQEPKVATFDPQTKPTISPPCLDTSLAQIDEYGFPQVTKMMPEMLDTELFTYKDGSDNHFFKMELKLKDHKLFSDIPEEFLFIIDLTQKNAKKNLTLYKDTIFKSLKLLKKSDRFNIVFINRSITFLYPKTKNYNPTDASTLDQDFDKKVQYSGKFKDVIKHLSSIFDKTEENELHTHCFLFTEEPTQDKDSFLHLSKYAHSKLSVYPIAYADDKQTRATLSSFVESMNGSLLVPPTKASFSRKFNALILDIKKTKLRNVSVKLDSEQGPVDINILEKTKYMTLHKPLKIFGKLNDQKNLKLQIVGSHGNDLFEMTKNLSIQGAKKGSFLIKQEFEKHN